MKNIKNSQPQTKFTGSYKKKQCNTNDVRTLNDLPINWENLPIFRWVSSFFTLISMLNCQNIHTARNTESVQEKLSAIFLKKHRRWGSPFTASDCYLQLVFTPTMFMKKNYNMYSNASKLKRNQISCSNLFSKTICLSAVKYL